MLNLTTNCKTINALYAIPNLMQLIGCRQKVAQDLLRVNGEQRIELTELFNYTNEEIKKVLGV
jgi:hypothetical protein